MIYLDHAAATPLDERVLEAMRPYLQDDFYNPSALYAPARKVRTVVDDYRGIIASTIGAKPTEIIFTAGATESINLAFAGVMKRFPGSKAAIGAIEHSAVLAAAEGYCDSVISLPVETDGRLRAQTLEGAIDDEVALISVGYVNGEIGVIQDLREVSRIVANIRESRVERGISTPLYLHSDASQAPGYIAVQVGKLGVDLLTLNGAKIYGPKHSGILYVRHGIELQPLIYGGGQERGLRGGTENVAALAGLATALEIAQAGHREESKRQSLLQSQLLRGLSTISAMEVNGSLKHRISGNVNISFRGLDGETLLHYLDARNILVATGSACSAGDNMPNATLVALGCDEEAIAGSLRLSLGRKTTSEEIDTVTNALKELVPKLRNR